MSRNPTVSVVIATKNRAHFLDQSIKSVLNQTFKDFELLIVDDGSTDHTKEVVQSYTDHRVKYLANKSGTHGISAARNIGALSSRGLWTAVHDDDDLMLPWRLEQQLNFANDDDDFIFGTFINFDDSNGSLQFHHGRQFNYGSALSTGFAPGHSTWLVKTQLIKDFGYDDGLESAVDNNLAFRLLRSGVNPRHSGVICLLRRVHSGRITNTGGQSQKYAAQLNLQFLQSGIDPNSREALWKEARYNWGPTDKTDWQTRFLPFLPDHLVQRQGVVFYPIDEEDGKRFRIISGSELTWEEVYQLAGNKSDLRMLSARYREAPNAERFLRFSATNQAMTDTSSALDKFIFTLASKSSSAPIASVIYADKKCNAEDFSKLVCKYFHFEQGTEKVLAGFKTFETISEASAFYSKVNKSPYVERFVFAANNFYRQ